MMTPVELRAAAAEDLSQTPRDILEFNLRSMVKQACDWIDMLDRQHAEQLANIRHQADAGVFLLPILTRLAAAGRKTVRIDELLADADLLLAAMHAKEADRGQA